MCNEMRFNFHYLYASFITQLFKFSSGIDLLLLDKNTNKLTVFV